MANLVVGPIIEKVISACSDCLIDQVGLKTDKKKALERLRAYQFKIQAVVDFASSQEQIRDQNPGLYNWVWQLRDAIDEARDVVDEFERLKHEEQLTKNTEGTKKRKISSFMRELIAPKFIKRLEDAVQRLEEVSTSVESFILLFESMKPKQEEQEVDLYRARETGSFPTNDLIGRGKDKENLMRWLRPSNVEHHSPNKETSFYKNIFALSIVGHGGMGKTALLQNIYHDKITKEFDLKMWVFVSKNFDVNRVIALMLESLHKKKPDSDSLGALQYQLENAVSSKKFLLILDDVWKEEENSDISKWEKVFALLARGKFGSKILVTTRMNSVAMMIANVIKKKPVIFTLKGLKDDDCLQLLKSHAFSGVASPNDLNILRDIVKKLSGYPLAAKVIGYDIKSKFDEGDEMTIPERNLSITSLGKNYIYSIIRPSYMFLSYSLRICFAFCCLFPQDYLFDKDGLVRMWIALGFIQPSDQKETVEDIGGRYFDDLVKNSFFDEVEDLRYYKMHVLLRETASKFYPQEYSTVVDNEKLSPEISKTIRHLYIQTIKPDILREIGKVKYLHSLFLSYEASDHDFYINALIEILKASKSLRLLHISTPRSLEKIPDDIGNLNHLRCLKIDGSNLTMLPRSLRNLYHLQYIIYEGPSGFSQPQVDEFLPSDINNLCNLRYLILPLNYVSSIHGIGKLKSLQELDVFDFRNVNGYRIGELKYMNDLRKLRINNLENVDVQEAHSANLRDKRRLEDLTLDWNFTNSRNNDLDENVLENLQPQDCLRNLSVRNYMGARSANWMMDANRIRELVKIELINCEEWETLPPFGQLFFLKSLTLCNMPKVKLLENTFSGNGEPCVFQSLKVLRIERLKALEDWFQAEIDVEDGRLFPCLIELVLKDCPVLKELPYLPSELKSLEIKNIGWTNLEFCSFSNSIPLETLKVCDCQNIASLPLADEIARLEALRNLAIKNCPNLTSLAKLPGRIMSDPSESLSSLQEQSINEVSMLRESPNLPPSLKDLSISNCHPELFERYGDGGSDRPNLAHIPNIHIDR